MRMQGAAQPQVVCLTRSDRMTIRHNLCFSGTYIARHTLTCLPCLQLQTMQTPHAGDRFGFKVIIKGLWTLTLHESTHEWSVRYTMRPAVVVSRFFHTISIFAGSWFSNTSSLNLHAPHLVRPSTLSFKENPAPVRGHTAAQCDVDIYALCMTLGGVQQQLTGQQMTGH